MIELVIFDADGVLFDSSEANASYYNAIFERAEEPPLDAGERKACVFYSARQMFEMRARGEATRFARLTDVARTVDPTPFFKLFRPFLDLRAFMGELKRRYRLALATNRAATVPALLNHLGLDDFFSVVACLTDGVRPKPAPDLLRLCLKRANISAERAVYVGDSEIDREAAEAADLRFIGVGCRVDHRHHVRTLGDLPRVLEELAEHAGGVATGSRQSG